MNGRKIFGVWAAAVLIGTAAFAARGDGGPADKAAELGYDGGMVCYVRVADLEKSLRWYEDALGLELLSRNDAIGWCELQSPATGLAIGLLQEARADVRGGATVVFGVKDLDAARGVLERRGVKFQGSTTAHEGYVKLAAFFDPDGNLFTLSQSLAPQQADRGAGDRGGE
jgi:predicted enzyme related to lactoylglutathione lyase